jgi:hypothetical protein
MVHVFSDIKCKGDPENAFAFSFCSSLSVGQRYNQLSDRAVLEDQVDFGNLERKRDLKLKPYDIIVHSFQLNSCSTDHQQLPGNCHRF